MHPPNKTNLAASCAAILMERMKEAEIAMLAAQESANSNEKSSMGDKYETGRAMGQLDRDMHARRLANLQDEFGKLNRIDLTVSYTKIETGALVQTEMHWYWIAISLGQIDIDGQKVMVVSPQSPLALCMKGLSVKDQFEFKGSKQKIIRVC